MKRQHRLHRNTTKTTGKTMYNYRENITSELLPLAEGKTKQLRRITITYGRKNDYETPKLVLSNCIPEEQYQKHKDDIAVRISPAYKAMYITLYETSPVDIDKETIYETLEAVKRESMGEKPIQYASRLTYKWTSKSNILFEVQKAEKRLKRQNC
jgi:hypothetical protein